MSRWINWTLGGVAVVAVGVVAGAKLVAPPIIKSRAEAELTKKWGAEVNIADVDVHLLPVGVTVHGIQLTDPNNPKQNLVYIASAYAEPALMDMLRMDMKPILDVVDVAGLEMHKARRHAGRVYRKPDQLVAQTRTLAQQAAAGKLPEFRLPDPQKILASEDLRTVQVAEDLKKQIAALQKQWEDIQKSLPGGEVVKQYQAELSQLQKGGLNPQSLQKIQALKSRIEQDRKKLAEAKKLLARVTELKKQLAQLKSLPAQDLRRLQQKYTFNAQGMTRVMETLLGDQVRQYLSVATGWVSRIRPLLNQPAQQKSAEPNPALDTLVRTLKINGRLPTGQFDALARNVTLNQALYQVTTPYRIDFRHQHADKPVEIKGVADLLNPSQAQIKALLEGVGLHLKDLPLSSSPTLGVLLRQAQANLTGKADLISWEKIRGEVDGKFAQVALDVLQASQPEVQKYLKPVLENIRDFNLKVKFSGSLYAPKIAIQSDLDKVLGKTLQRVMQQQLTQVKKQLMAELQQRAQSEMGQLSGMLGPLVSAQGQVNGLDGQLDQLLKKALTGGKGNALPIPSGDKGGLPIPGGIKLPGF
ncbi:TIGR03545 family protein [Sulfurivirga sp.]|uniref:TIGR03545 family protein n=1 Tax=Sulfurivirga sp. TaxID=2614236 RepID=UPI0025ED652D|nr:TIGR03545 family protein [Sulfurivirga sp.]